MGRTAVRTRELLRDTVEQILSLFGTIKNAHRRLGLDGLIPYHNFNRALHHYTISKEDKEKIEAAWDRWRELFLVERIPQSVDFTLTPELSEEFPTWHPRATKLADDDVARLTQGRWSSEPKTVTSSSSGSSSAPTSRKKATVAGNGAVEPTAKAMAR